jgi:hypothetical protein
MENYKLIRSTLDLGEKPSPAYFAVVEADGELQTIVVLSNRIFGSSEPAADAIVSNWMKMSDWSLWQVDSFKELVAHVGRELTDSIIIDYNKKVGRHQ